MAWARQAVSTPEIPSANNCQLSRTHWIGGCWPPSNGSKVHNIFLGVHFNNNMNQSHSAHSLKTPQWKTVCPLHTLWIRGASPCPMTLQCTLHSLEYISIIISGRQAVPTPKISAAKNCLPLSTHGIGAAILYLMALKYTIYSWEFMLVMICARSTVPTPKNSAMKNWLPLEYPVNWGCQPLSNGFEMHTTLHRVHFNNNMSQAGSAHPRNLVCKKLPAFKYPLDQGLLATI